MSNYATIEYPEVNLIIDLSNNCSLYPLSVIKKLNDMLLSHSGYSRGFCEIENHVSVVIDFAEFLNITPLEEKKETIILRMTGFKGDFALIIPTPKFIQGEIDFKKDDQKIKSEQGNFSLLSSDYCIIDDIIFLRVDGKQISKLLSDEISTFLTSQWNRTLPNWSNLPDDNLAKILKKSIISTSAKEIKQGKIIDLKNTIILTIGNYKFSFPETLLSELTIYNHQLTNIPDSPEWVTGAFNFNNESLALIDLRSLFGIVNTTNDTQLVTIINISNTLKLGLLCDSLDNISMEANKLNQLLPSSKRNDFPYNHISQYETNFIFSLNINFLTNSISNADIIKIQDDWKGWREFLSSDVNTTLDVLKSNKGIIEQKKLTEYVEINYQKINILIELTKDTSFFPDQKVNRIKQHPEYCEGIANLGNSNCLVIDFAMFLGIDEASTQETILLTIAEGFNSNIALRIPKPKLVNFDIKSKTSQIIDNDNNNSIKIPSSKYHIIDNLVFLMLDQINLFQFLRNELKLNLTEKWKNSLPIFDTISPNKIADLKVVKTQISMSSTTQVSTIISDHNKFLICKIDDSYFGIKESDVIQVIVREFKTTKIPNSPTWIDGLIDFQNDDIPLVNLSNMFQIEEGGNSTGITVVVSHMKNKIALKCDSIYHTSSEDKISIKQEDIDTYDLPYTNIIEIDGKIIFVLNLDYILKSTLISHQDLKSTEWEKLLSFSTVDFHDNQLFIERNKIFDNDSIHAKIHRSGYSLPLNQIISIQSVSNKQRINYDNIDLVAYNGKWVPSFQIDLENSYESESSHDISLIMKLDGLIFELQVDKLKLINQGDQLIDQSTWQTLLKRNNPIGLNTPVDTDEGLAFRIDLETFVNTTIRSLNNKIKNVKDFISSVDVEPPENIEDSLISKEMAQIWEENLELYLIINNKKNNVYNKFALLIEQISDITLDLPEDTEIINWKYGQSESYFYVNLRKTEKNEKALKIPSNCYLHGIERENIKKENGDTFLIVGDEKIPLLNISNQV